MPSDDRQLLAVSAPFTTTPENLEEQTIKGFVSVEKIDRSQELVPPEEFNVAQFMAIPTMMVNHKFWRDRAGNDVGVGTPRELFVAKLAKNENSELWSVVDEKTGEVRNTYPKSKVPNLRAGDRGLFMVAEITRDDVWDMIKSGEINGFSWRGLVRVDFKVDPKTNEIQKVLRDIDLFEISVVNIPDQPNSSLLIGKSVETDSDDTQVVFAVRFLKTVFPSKKMVEAFLESHQCLKSDTVLDERDNFLVPQRSSKGLDPKRFATLRLHHGVHIITGPMTEESKSRIQATETFCPVAQALGSETADLLIQFIEKGKQHMATEKEVSKETEIEKTVEDDVKTEKEEKKTAEQAKTEETPVEKTEAEKGLEALAGAVSKQTAEAVSTAMTPLFEGLSNTLSAFGETIKSALVESKSTEVKEEVAEKSETEKAAAAILSKFETLTQQVKEAKTEAEKTAQTLKKVTPAATTREETVKPEKEEVEKGAGDPNSCFDSLWSFLPG